MARSRSHVAVSQWSIGLIIAAALAACGGGTASSPPTPVPQLPVSAATAPPIPSPSPFSVSSQAPLPAVTQPPAGQTPQPVPVALPTASGYSGSVQLPIASASSIPANTQAIVQLADTAPSGIPTLSVAHPRAAVVHGLSSSTIVPLLYISLGFSGGVTLANQPAISVSVPAADIVSGVYYYMAFYDPTNPSAGWQYGFEGPGTVSGSQIVFTGGAGSFSYAPFTMYWYGLYAQPQILPTPTPAPSPTPTPQPTATPTPIVVNGVQLNAIGATYDATPTGAGPFVAFSSDTSVVTVTSGSSTVITAVGAGTATVTIGGPNGTTTVNVTVTTTTVPVQ